MRPYVPVNLAGFSAMIRVANAHFAVLLGGKQKQTHKNGAKVRE